MDNKRSMNFEQVKKAKDCCNFIYVLFKYIFSLINFDYLKDWNNLAEQCMFFLNIYYIEERFRNPMNQLAKVENLKERKDLENDDTRI